MADALATLIKLANAEIDERKRRLQQAVQAADALEQQLHRLEQAMVEEREVAKSDPVTLDYGRWAARASEERQELDEGLKTAEQEVAAALQAVTDAWRHQQSLEKTRDARAQREAAAAEQTAQTALQELSLDRFLRQSR